MPSHKEIYFVLLKIITDLEKIKQSLEKLEALVIDKKEYHYSHTQTHQKNREKKKWYFPS